MLVDTVLAAAAAKPMAVAIIGVAVAELVIATALAVRMTRRHAPPSDGGYADAPGADGGSTERSSTSVDVQARWRRLVGDLDAGLVAALYTGPTTHAAPSPTPDVAPADPGAGVHADATRFFAGPPADPDPATPFAGPTQDPASARRPDDATRLFGLDDDPASPGPAQTRFFGPDELADDDAVADHAADGPTGGLLALPPATHKAAPGGGDGYPAPCSRTRVREHLSAVSMPHVVALSVIDSAGRVLAGATDDDVAGELRSLMAESGLGNTADLVQPMRFADDSHGAMLLLPTGANALLGALVRDTDDLQATRARLRGLAHQIGDAMRAAS